MPNMQSADSILAFSVAILQRKVPDKLMWMPGAFESYSSCKLMQIFHLATKGV